MTRPLRRRLAAALIAISAAAAGCGGGTDPPRTPNVETVEDTTAEQGPATGIGAPIDRTRDVAADLEARNDALND